MPEMRSWKNEKKGVGATFLRSWREDLLPHDEFYRVFTAINRSTEITPMTRQYSSQGCFPLT